MFQTQNDLYVEYIMIRAQANRLAGLLMLPNTGRQVYNILGPQITWLEPF